MTKPRTMIKANDSVNLDGLHPDMIEFIHRLEEKLSTELTITSGYRSATHHIEAAKKSPGEHSEGLAVDVYCATPRAFVKLVGEAYRLGCRRIGVSRKSGFVHIGLSGRRPESLWTY